MGESKGSGGVAENRKNRLDQLYELREEFRTVADSDTPFAEYAQNALVSLREAGYDV